MNSFLCILKIENALHHPVITLMKKENKPKSNFFFSDEMKQSFQALGETLKYLFRVVEWATIGMSRAERFEVKSLGKAIAAFSSAACKQKEGETVYKALLLLSSILKIKHFFKTSLDLSMPFRFPPQMV